MLRFASIFSGLTLLFFPLSTSPPRVLRFARKNGLSDDFFSHVSICIINGKESWRRQGRPDTLDSCCPKIAVFPTLHPDSVARHLSARCLRSPDQGCVSSFFASCPPGLDMGTDIYVLAQYTDKGCLCVFTFHPPSYFCLSDAFFCMRCLGISFYIRYASASLLPVFSFYFYSDYLPIFDKKAWTRKPIDTSFPSRFRWN